MRSIMVTGGAGFIGSNFVRYWRQQYPEDRIVNVDCLTYAGNMESLGEADGLANYRFVHGSVCDQSLLERVFAEEAIDTVVHFAAETHVDRSILRPDCFIKTNIEGTFTLLNAALNAWKTPQSRHRFLHVSTDEVYGSLKPTDACFTENTPYAPNSPYAASKAAADHMVRAFSRTYGLPAITTNCSNNYGPYQFPEKLVPLTIINALEGKPIPVYGDGQNIRDWLHVEDHCRGIEVVLNSGRLGETYNLGGCNELRNIDIVTLICDVLDRLRPESRPRCELVTFVKDRPGHDRRYAIDCAKASAELGWTPTKEFRIGIEQTVQWYLANELWWQRVRDGDYRNYYVQQYGEESGFTHGSLEVQ